jgi:hypothetical protein
LQYVWGEKSADMLLELGGEMQFKVLHFLVLPTFPYFGDALFGGERKIGLHHPVVVCGLDVEN